MGSGTKILGLGGSKFDKFGQNLIKKRVKNGVDFRSPSMFLCGTWTATDIVGVLLIKCSLRAFFSLFFGQKRRFCQILQKNTNFGLKGAKFSRFWTVFGRKWLKNGLEGSEFSPPRLFPRSPGHIFGNYFGPEKP